MRRPNSQLLAVWCMAGIVWAVSLWMLWKVDYRAAVGVLLAFVANNIDERVRQLRGDERYLGGKR